MKTTVKIFALLLLHRAWSYWARRTKKLAERVALGEIERALNRHKLKGNEMSFSKSVALFGGAGQLVASEAAGVVTLAVTAGASFENGALKFESSNEFDVGAEQLIDLGLELAAAKYPAAASLINEVKALADAAVSSA
jgi:hypothetical protein